MTARHSLSDFMPYGAPELIAAQRPNLLRPRALPWVPATGLLMLPGPRDLPLPPHPIEVPLSPQTPPAPSPIPPLIAEPKPKGVPSVVPSRPKGPAYPVVDEVLVPSID